MKLVIPKTILTNIISQVELVNEESCGFLIGIQSEDFKSIENYIKTENISKEDKKKRFEIAPLEYLKAENSAISNGWDLLGIYHTHLDSAPIPSKTDLKFALEGFSYLIISINNQRFHSMRSWTMDKNKFFKEENLKILNV
ncbi:M67 family metallopeptidase [Shivajiella indica]|uniref:M67 family metallopeptidase n=1 Tax=Shivajiella indica TaxID=872115 RepID=A0ABW5BEJ8_9BACT